MKTLWLFPAGFLIGAAIVWAALRPAPETDSAAHAAGPSARTAPGTWSPARAIPGHEPDGLDAPLPADLADEFEDGLEGDRAQRYHLALATIHAIGNRLDPFLDQATLALEFEASVGALQSRAGLFPADRRPAVLLALAAAHPELEWSRLLLAKQYRAAGEDHLAFGVVQEELECGKGNLESLAKKLIEIDPGRAADVLIGLAVRLEWPDSLLAEIADDLVDRERGDLARPFLLMALEKNPLHSGALAQLSDIDLSAALGYAVTATRRAPDDEAAWGRLAALQLRTGDASAAFECYAHAAQAADPEDRTPYLRGLLATDPRAALPIIEELLDPKDDDSVGLFGRAQLMAGRPEDAFGSFARALDLKNTDVEWLHQLVATDPARAAAHIQQILERTTATSNRDEIVGAHALALQELGARERAYDRFLEASAMDPDDYEWLRGLASSDPERAASHLEKRLRDEPESGPLAGALADSYARLGRTEAAARLYEKAIESGSSVGRWRAAYAQIAPEEGLAALRESIAAQPGDDELWGALGDAYRGLGRSDEARKAYDEAIRLDPGDWEWNMHRDHMR